MSYGGFEYGGGGFGDMGGGGGFGSSQGGGGYMAGSAVDSPAVGGGGGGGGGAQRNRDKQSILSLNIKQVLESDMPSQDSAVKVDGVEVAQIKVVGCIVDLEDASTNTEYTIEDTTGRLKVKIFHSDAEGSNDRSTEKRARNQIGTYVRVYGNIRSWNGDRHSVAYEMQPISDFNEVTMHSLEVIYTHLFNTKGPLLGNSTISTGAASRFQPLQGQGMGSPAFHAQGGQPFASPANNHYDRGNMGNATPGGTDNLKGFTDIQHKVHEEFRRMDEEQGRSVDEVIAALRPSGISPHDVQMAVSFLSSEGHLYSTVDDNHFRSTDA